MTTPESRGARGSAARRATPAPPAGGDEAASRDAHGTPRADESKYDPATVKRPGVDPLTVKIEFVVVHGPAADELIKRQATAIRDALQWFAEHLPDE